MLQPKRVKYRKVHRGHRRGKAQAGNTMNFGEYGLQAVQSAWISSRQIEAARRALTRHIRRRGNIWVRVFPDKSVTKKPAETRQGGGKGSPEYWVAVVKPGKIMFEMSDVKEDIAKEAMRLAAHKLPINTQFVVKRVEVAGG